MDAGEGVKGLDAALIDSAGISGATSVTRDGDARGGSDEARGRRGDRGDCRRVASRSRCSSTSSTSSSDKGLGGTGSSAGGGTIEASVTSGEAPGKLPGTCRARRDEVRRKRLSGLRSPGKGGSVALRLVEGLRGAPGATLLVGCLGGILEGPLAVGSRNEALNARREATTSNQTHSRSRVSFLRECEGLRVSRRMLRGSSRAL